ncbi:hypothetical protein ONZ51_g1222 [Trametes cubensis]|uniref:Uncharacterized protein n=1 Tax=Trametes cubensis TaxID=1111947 RepID=A0AAD7XF37_9APHY|nr:hypothetical protein ONZ51_g1222 [Trametes cubensis]
MILINFTDFNPGSPSSNDICDHSNVGQQTSPSLLVICSEFYSEPVHLLINYHSDQREVLVLCTTATAGAALLVANVCLQCVKKLSVHRVPPRVPADTVSSPTSKSGGGEDEADITPALEDGPPSGSSSQAIEGEPGGDLDSSWLQWVLETVTGILASTTCGVFGVPIPSRRASQHPADLPV